VGFNFGDYLDAECLREPLGIDEVVAVDASSYEGARLVHDLNTPIPVGHHSKYDLVIDGGTLEHVFNIPVALTSCMQALRAGGRYLGVNPVNNLVGHGFYQFSPEFYFRVFSSENGFRLDKIELQESRYPIVELGYVSRKYEPIDPAAMSARGELITSRPLMARVLATKVADVFPFSQWPQQSDYLAAWHNHPGGQTNVAVSFRAMASAVLPLGLRSRLFAMWQRRLARLNNRHRFVRR
jgi:hypothetical protein